MQQVALGSREELTLSLRVDSASSVGWGGGGVGWSWAEVWWGGDGMAPACPVGSEVPAFPVEWGGMGCGGLGWDAVG